MLSFNVRETSGPPAGIYSAEFVGVEETTHEQYGAGAIFKWKVVMGEHAGKIASRTCKPEATMSNVTGKMIAGLLGGQFKPGEVSLEACVGKRYTIVVGPTKDGQRTRVESVMLA